MCVVLFCSTAMSIEAKPSHKATGTGAKPSAAHVRGHVTKRGKYVAPHVRSTSDKTKSNNWSTKGNVNPVTGKPGTK